MRERVLVGSAVFTYGALVAAVFAFVIYPTQGLFASTIDLNWFGWIARNLASGNGFSSGYGPTIRRGPLYPLVGGVLLAIFRSDVPGATEADLYRPMIIANCLIFGLTAWAVWVLARRISGDRVALAAALASPLVPQSLRYVGMTEVETLLGLCVVLLALTGHAFATRPGPISGAAFGISAGVATLAKSIVLPYPLIFLSLCLWQWKTAGASLARSVAGSVLMLVCFAGLLLPWVVRNLNVTDGQFLGISSNGPGEFLRGYVNTQPKYVLLQQDFGGSGQDEKWDPEANQFEEDLLRPYGLPFYRPARSADGVPVFIPTPPPGFESARMETEKDRIEGAEVRRLVLQNPLSFAEKFVFQIFTFWYLVETRGKSLAVGAIALVTVVLAAIGALRARRAGKTIWPVLAIIVFLNVTYAVFLALGRYSMPLFPTLVVLATGGAAYLAESLLRRVPIIPRAFAAVSRKAP